MTLQQTADSILEALMTLCDELQRLVYAHDKTRLHLA
jgi:hypothetical protein